MSQTNNPIESERPKDYDQKQGDHPVKDKDDHANQQKKRDKILKDSFPASDPPPT